MNNTDFRTLSASSQEKIRRGAVRAVNAGGKPKEVALRYGVTRQAVTKWMRLYNAEGEAALAAKPRGAPKRHGPLEPWQCDAAIRIIAGKCPDQLRLAGFTLWTREAVRSLLDDRYGVKLSPSTIGRLLRRWGISILNPATAGGGHGPAARDKVRRRWMTNEYPAICEYAKLTGARVMWGDVCALDGCTVETEEKTSLWGGTSKCGGFACNMLSAVDASGHAFFSMFAGAFTDAILVAFWQRLIRRGRKKTAKVIFIADDRLFRCGPEAERWLRENEESIRVFFCPRA